MKLIKNLELSLIAKFKLLSVSLLFILIPSSGLLFSILQFPQAIQGKAIAILCATLFITIISIYSFLLIAIVRPLKRISKIAQKVSRGERCEDFPVRAIDEIGTLTIALNRMKISQEMALDEMLQLEKLTLENNK